MKLLDLIQLIDSKGLTNNSKPLVCDRQIPINTDRLSETVCFVHVYPNRIVFTDEGGSILQKVRISGIIDKLRNDINLDLPVFYNDLPVVDIIEQHHYVSLLTERAN